MKLLNTLFAVAAASLTAAVTAQPQAAGPIPVADVLADGLTIAGYNVENMFDAWDDPYADDESADPKFDYELKALATTIRESNADVVGIAEVENAQVLQLMVDRYLADAGYAYVHVNPTNSSRGINLGFISRLPIAAITSHRFDKLTLPGDSERNWYYARDLLQVRIDLEGHGPAGDDDGLLDLFIVHFKSKRTIVDRDPQSSDWRTAEAHGAAREIAAILDADPEAMVAMTGDFNDERDTRALKALAKHQPGATGLLTDVHYELPEAARISYLNEPYRNQIDFLLVSDTLADAIVPGSAVVYNDDARKKASDHALVKATFKVIK